MHTSSTHTLGSKVRANGQKAITSQLVLGFFLDVSTYKCRAHGGVLQMFQGSGLEDIGHGYQSVGSGTHGLITTMSEGQFPALCLAEYSPITVRTVIGESMRVSHPKLSRLMFSADAQSSLRLTQTI
jgi:hypothetical protein